MTFFISSLYQCSRPLPQQPEAIELLHPSQKWTGAIDLLLLAGIVIVAGLILANNANCIQLPGLNGISNQIAYSILGTSAGVLFADLVIHAIQSCIKFQAISERNKGHKTLQLADKEGLAQNPTENNQPQKKVQIQTDDTRKDSTPYIENEFLYISNEQAELIKRDPYLKNFVSGDFGINTIEDGELFLNNLKIFFSSEINALCQKAEGLGLIQLQKQIEAYKFKDQIYQLSITLGLTKDAAFIRHNKEAIVKGLQTVLDNLAYADMMGNQVLVLFWCQVLKNHMPFYAFIDIFEDVLQLPLSTPEYLHEILFECLMDNINTAEAKNFLNIYNGKLKIKTLGLGSVLSTQAKTDNIIKILNIIDLQYIEILKWDTTDFVSDECKFLLSQCPKKICMQVAGRIGDMTNRQVEVLRRIEDNILVIDLTDHIWKIDPSYFETTVDRIYLDKIGIKIFYLVKYKNEVDAYLKVYYGTSLEKLSQTNFF